MSLSNTWRDALGALSSEGFLRVQLSEFSQKSVLATFDAGYTFFRQPNEAKTQLAMEQDLGYRAFGDEYSISTDFPDQLESFSVSPRLPISPHQIESMAARILYDKMSQTFELFEPIIEDLTVHLAKSLSGGRIGEQLKGKFKYWELCLKVGYERMK